MAEVLLRMQVFVRGAAGRVDADSAGADAISCEMSKVNRSTRTLSERSEFVRVPIRCERASMIACDEDEAETLPASSAYEKGAAEQLQQLLEMYGL